MKIDLKQISSLDKVFPTHIGDVLELDHLYAMGGQRLSYQIAIECKEPKEIYKIVAKVESKLAEYVKLYSVGNVIVDTDISYWVEDTDYISNGMCILPDVLNPLPKDNATIRAGSGGAAAMWVTVDVPRDLPTGDYTITLKLQQELMVAQKPLDEAECQMSISVLPCNIPEQKTLYTQWFFPGCIADYHNVPVFSEAHWALIDAYMKLYTELGGNTILTHIITAPVDVPVNGRRTNEQLVDIKKDGDTYSFDFTKLDRWVDMAHKHGITHFEMAHLFSQWGLEYTPNILVEENGEETYFFGWHMKANDPAYKNFLEQFLPAVVTYCKEKGIQNDCYFHLSDEPNDTHLDNYQYARNIVKALLEGCPMMDALSNYAYYEKGLVPVPVPATSHIEPFIDKETPKDFWIYYCGSQNEVVSNRFINMPSCRNRIIGLQMYKFGVNGFLHWGYNFYTDAIDGKGVVNPYLNTSRDKVDAPGDAFSVYPTRDGAVPSLRAVIFKEALDDIEVCRKLEEFIGRDAVVKMIDDAAGMNLTFKEYPRDKEFIPNLMEKMMEKIMNFL